MNIAVYTRTGCPYCLTKKIKQVHFNEFYKKGIFLLQINSPGHDILIREQF